MTNQNDPFDDALDESEEKWISEAAEGRQERWEERVVKRLTNAHIGAPSAYAVIRELKNEIMEKTGEPRLFFDSFLLLYPQFPIWLCCRPIPYAHDRTDYGNFFVKSEHLFTSIYRKAKVDVPAEWGDKPYGVVFEMLNKGSPFNLLHNHYVPLYPFKGVRLQLGDPKGAPDGPIWLDNLDIFLQSIGWAKGAE